MPRILVVSLNYRTPDMTLRSAKTALGAMQGLDAQLVIVDNDSGDGSFEKMVQAVETEDWAQGQPVRVVQSGHNGGFGAGNNFAIRLGCSDGVRADYVYILNSDAFPKPDALRKLLNHMEANPKTAFAGSYIHGEDGETHLSTFRFPSIDSEFEGALRLGVVSWLLRNRTIPIWTKASQCVDWISGASVLMRQDVLDEIGLFDERFFLYYEETDLCLRAHQAGHEVHYVHDSEVMHIGSVSTGMGGWTRVPQYWLDSRWYYFSKNHGRIYAALATLFHLGAGVLWRIRRVIQRKPKADPPYFLRDLVVHDLKAVFRPIAGKIPKTGVEDTAEVKAE
ncbi:MAG: glycosyltransferase family 2 protein [Pelagimonas sp.]|jgi:GT2 family glycosyltransferase|nr:glycosyltransferase family 2 protein [Pelagimonas sp.]